MGLLAAILRDPNPIHWDRAEVAARGLGDRLINQGPINVAYVCNAIAAWAGPTALRSLTVRFTANVFDGDEVVAGGTVTAVDEAGGDVPGHLRRLARPRRRRTGGRGPGRGRRHRRLIPAGPDDRSTDLL